MGLADVSTQLPSLIVAPSAILANESS